MFYPRILNNNFRKSYRFCRVGAVPEGTGKRFYAIRFHDLPQAQQFLKSFSVPQNYWRRFLYEMDSGLPLQKLDDYGVLSRLAERLLSGHLRVFEIPWVLSQKESGSIVSSKGKDGFQYSIKPAEILLVDKPPHIVTIQSPREVEENLSQVDLNPRQLRPLLQSIGVPKAATADDEDLLYLTKQAILENRLLITKTRLPPPRTIQKLETAIDTPGNKKPSLAPESSKRKTWFQLKLVDEVGEAISGVDFNIRIDGEHKKLSTGGDGSIKIDNVFDLFASAKIIDSQQIADIVEPRWENFRKGDEPEAKIKNIMGLIGKASAFSIKNEAEHLIVIKPPQGQLFVELRDKHGRVAHANREYKIEGPLTFSGTTDDRGILKHPDVPMGEYTLTLTLTFFEGTEAEQTDTYNTNLVVLESTASEPQVRLLGAVPRSELVRIRGMLFDTNKSFLLPGAVRHMEHLRELYNLNNPGELLIVGHTDTTGEPDINDPLSLERAENVKAFLEDNVDPWLNMYDSAATAKGTWGAREDRLMIIAMPDFSSAEAGSDLVKWFQKTRNLKVDGIAGPQTRKQLISEYMALDGIKFADTPELDLTISVHGCGENFPLDESGENLDANPENEKEDRLDRRVEFFFFDREFGIVPKPASADGAQYNVWREQAGSEFELIVEHNKKQATIIELHDALFRTNSCVVLPEGETPAEEHEAVTSVGLFAATIRFADERRGKKLFIAGHTDTTGTVDFNQTLSEERAKCALAVLENKREDFVKLANARHTVADYKQILSWCTAAFPDKFNCKPEKIDDNAATGIDSVKRFQNNFNEHKLALGSTADNLKPDGAIGPLTWGAIFDVYQFGINEELGEDKQAVAELRKSLVFVDTDRKALGFSEHHTVDAVGRNNVRSQSNRRVEILFFDQGEEPDLVLAETNPDLCEIYLASEFVHKGVDMVSAKPWKAAWIETESAAVFNQSRTARTTAPGIPAGVPITFTFTALADETLLQEYKIIEQAVSSENTVEFKFESWFDESMIKGTNQELSDLPTVKFQFTMEGGGRITQSNLLTYSDTLKGTLLHNDTGEAAKKIEYRLLTPWGFLECKTDNDGKLEHSQLPPGGALVAARNFRLISNLG